MPGVGEIYVPLIVIVSVIRPGQETPVLGDVRVFESLERGNVHHVGSSKIDKKEQRILIVIG